MDALTPQTPEELAEALGAASAARTQIRLGGRFTKQNMAGPTGPVGTVISTRCLQRVIQYEPRDLTISVEAGLLFAELRDLLARNRQMVPLDPPFSEESTVGGVIAANLSGPRRRLYGTARDMVIGMKFATVDGKLVQSGGMVVKNVAGLDMAKLLIGSFGTLAAIAVVNFKVIPAPPFSRSFLLAFDSPEQAIKARDGILRSVLQPAAVDLLNPQASARLGLERYLLIIQAGGNAAVIERYSRELPQAQAIEGSAEEDLWRRVRNFAPDFLAGNPDGVVVRVPCTLSAIGPVMESAGAPVLARAGSGPCYVFFPDCAAATAWMQVACSRGWKSVANFSPPASKDNLELWPCPGDDLAVLEKIKQMFDPLRLLNRGRLYGRI